LDKLAEAESVIEEQVAAPPVIAAEPAARDATPQIFTFDGWGMVPLEPQPG
jgi:hypothetical protein